MTGCELCGVGPEDDCTMDCPSRDAARGSRVLFRVLGTPATQGSMVPGKRKDGTMFVRPSSPKDLAPWRSEVARHAKDAAQQVGQFDGPVTVEALFRFKMPASRPSALRRLVSWWRPSKPDLDKLQRALGDALKTGGLLHDDAQVTTWHAYKVEVFAGWTGCEVRVSRPTALPPSLLPARGPAVSAALTTTVCRHCGARIAFVTTNTGNTMPVDPDPDPAGIVFLTRSPDGSIQARVGKRGEHLPGIRYTAHFATCPVLNKHRGVTTRRPEPPPPEVDQPSLF